MSMGEGQERQRQGSGGQAWLVRHGEVMQMHATVVEAPVRMSTCGMWQEDIHKPAKAAAVKGASNASSKKILP